MADITVATILKWITAAGAIITIIFTMFNPPLHIDYQKLSNTDNCFQNCECVFRMKTNRNFHIPSNWDFRITLNHELKDQGFKILKNDTFDVTEPIYENQSYQVWVGNNATNSSGYVTRWHYVKVGENVTPSWELNWYDFDPAGKIITKNKWHYIKIWGKKHIKLGENNVEFNLWVNNKKIPLSWWNSSYSNRINVTVTDTGGVAFTDYPVEINMNTTPLTGFYCGAERWVNESNNEVKFYRNNSCSSIEDNATWWPKIPDLPASGSKVLTMYYNNDTEFADYSTNISVMSTLQTYEAGTEGWSPVTGYGGSAVVSQSTDSYERTYSLNSTHTGSVGSNNPSDVNVYDVTDNKSVVEWYGKTIGDDSQRYYFLDHQADRTPSNPSNWDVSEAGHMVFYIRMYGATDFININDANAFAIETGDWIHFVVSDIDFTAHTFDINITNSTHTHSLEDLAFKDSVSVLSYMATFSWGAHGNSLFVDRLMVRNWTHPEPTYAIGTEESEPEVDTCTPGATIWNVNCNDNCTKTTDINVAGPINLYGNNGVLIFDNITVVATGFTNNATNCEIIRKDSLEIIG